MSPPDTMFQGLSEVAGAMWRVYLAMDSKVMYVSVNKNESSQGGLAATQ